LPSPPKFIQYAPSAGMVLMCDFSQYGFKPPEMVKERRCVIISAKTYNKRHKRCTLVPVSLSTPHETTYCIQTTPGKYDCFHPVQPCWILCDMPYTLDWRKLWFVQAHGRPQSFHLDRADLATVHGMYSNFP